MMRPQKREPRRQDLPPGFLLLKRSWLREARQPMRNALPRAFADYQPPILMTESMQLALSVLSLILSQYDDFLVLMASSR